MKNLIWTTDIVSESPDDYCEECLDSGFVHGGNESMPCACDSKFRARRVLARIKQRIPDCY